MRRGKLMNMKKILAIILTFCLSCSIFSGCDLLDLFTSDPGGSSQSGSSSQPQSSSNNDSKNWPVTVSGIAVPSKPTKVASLSPSLTEIVCDLGYGSALVCVSDYCDYPSSITSLTKAGSALLPDCNAIIASGAQYLLTSTELSDVDTNTLTDAGVSIIVLQPAKQLSALERLYKNIGAIFGGSVDGQSRGKSLYNECINLLEECKIAVSSLGFSTTNPPAALYLRVIDPLTVATVDTLESALLEYIGFTNIASGYGDWSYPADLAPNLTPDYLFFSSSIDPDELVSSELYSHFSGILKRMASTDMLVFERQGKRMFSELSRTVSLFLN